jgi:hypothetical protein
MQPIGYGSPYFDFDFDLPGFILDEPFPKKLFAPTSSIAKDYRYLGPYGHNKHQTLQYS